MIVQRIFQLPAGLIVLFCLVISSVLATANDAAPSDTNSDLCAKTAKAVQNACEAEGEANYWIAVGNCNNLSSASARKACKQQAQQDRRDANGECAEQFEARRKLCTALNETTYNPVINPTNFVEGITNPFFPMIPSTTLIYRGGNEVVTVTVTNRTKVILGVKCVVVRDVVTVNDQVVEDTEDYFAQDMQGNIWYFGELSQEFDNGDLISLAGSFKAGVNGAKPGIIMKANPQVGDIYRQEFLLGEAEDIAEVISLTRSESVPAASCNNDCLVTKESTPLEPGTIGNKYYAWGIGVILEINPASGQRVELVEIIRK
ncbi:MAG: hypothetical protein AB1489_32135 [Acidobacteriota bacterium]